MIIIINLLTLSLFLAFSSQAANIGKLTQPLNNGAETKEHEEVGIFYNTDGGGCTATLISPNHILTAAHCYKYLPYATNVGKFVVEKRDGSKISRNVKMWFGQGTSVGSDDWAVGYLDQPVNGIRYAEISTTQPRKGQTLTVVGYGCNDKKNKTGFGTKRYIEYSYDGRTSHYCSGDSGGPVFLGSQKNARKIIRVNSGHRTSGRKSDIGADAVRFRDHITAIQNGIPGKKICYRVHVKDKGWLPVKCNGDYAGTVNESRRMEAIQILSDKYNVCYSSHLSNIGWTKEVCNGAISGTTKKGRQMEAIRVNLKNSNSTSIFYTSHVADKGWLPWVADNKISGTVGRKKRMEAVRIVLK